MSADRENPGRIIGLDGLRAISILLVVIGHAWTTVSTRTPLDALAPYLGNAVLGVQTFFVISGFLITYLLRKEWGRSGTIGLKAFYVRRVLRIFPALYAFLLVLALLRMAGAIDTTWGDLGIAGTFLTNYKHVLGIPTNDHYWFVGQFWTLALEEQFYLFWPATVLAVGMLRAHRVALLIVLLAPLMRVISYFAWPEARGQISIMLHTAADPIMVGCLAALWQGHPRLERYLQQWSAWRWPLLAGLFVLFVNPWLTTRFRGMYSLTIGMSLNSAAIAFFMLWVIRHPASSLVRFLATPLMTHVGVLSYSLYLWNPLFLSPMAGGWIRTFPVNVLATWAAAEVSYRLVERPFLGIRDKLRRGARPFVLPSVQPAVIEVGSRDPETLATRPTAPRGEHLA